MKLHQFLFCALSFISLTVAAQNVAYVASADHSYSLPTTEVTSVSAQFPGGTDALTTYFADHLVYDAKARRNFIDGTVKVRFMVAPDGQLSDFEIVESPHQLLSQSALATVKSMPAWSPSTRNGAHVASTVVLPIQYTLK
jgi:TonB family protein